MTDEFELIARLAPFLASEGDGVAVGHGDDAAVLDVGGRGVAIAVDVMVEDVHFRRSLSSLEDVGWKVVTVNVSDLAAMGATPNVAVVGLAKPRDLAAADVEQLYTGMHAAAEHYGLRLVGGDTVAADALALSVTVLGDIELDQAVRRSGARPGDRIVVVGGLGAAATALAQVEAGRDADPSLLESHRRPVARVAAGRALAQHGATAMIDVSDGFGADLGHIAAASSVGARVDAESLPIAAGVSEAARDLGRDPVELAVGGGDDYALIACIPRERVEDALAETGGVDVGEITPSSDVMLHHPDGRTTSIKDSGWRHFAQRGPDTAAER